MNKQTIDTMTTKVGLGDIIYVKGSEVTPHKWKLVIAMLLAISTKKRCVLLYTLSLIDKHFKPQILTSDSILSIYNQSHGSNPIIKHMRNHFVPLILNVNITDFSSWRAVNTGIKMIDMKNWPMMAILAWAYNTDLIDMNQTPQFFYGQDYTMTDMDKFITKMRIKEGTAFNNRIDPTDRKHTVISETMSHYFLY